MTTASPTPPPPDPPARQPREAGKALSITNHIVAIIVGIMSAIGLIYGFVQWLRTGSQAEPPVTSQGDNAIWVEEEGESARAPTNKMAVVPDQPEPEPEASKPSTDEPVQQSEEMVARESTRGTTPTSPVSTPLNADSRGCPASVITMTFDPAPALNSRTFIRRRLGQGVTSVRIGNCQASGSFRTGTQDDTLSRSGHISSANIQFDFAYYHAGVVECSVSGTAAGPRAYLGSLRCENSEGSGVSLSNVEISL